VKHTPIYGCQFATEPTRTAQEQGERADQLIADLIPSLYLQVPLAVLIEQRPAHRCLSGSASRLYPGQATEDRLEVCEGRIELKRVARRDSLPDTFFVIEKCI